MRWLQTDPVCWSTFQVVIYWDLGCSYTALPTWGGDRLAPHRSVKPVSPPGCHPQLIQSVCSDNVYQPVCFPLEPNWHRLLCLCMCAISISLYLSLFFSTTYTPSDWLCGRHRRLFTETIQQGWIAQLKSDEWNMSGAAPGGVEIWGGAERRKEGLKTQVIQSRLTNLIHSSCLTRFLILKITKSKSALFSSFWLSTSVLPCSRLGAVLSGLPVSQLGRRDHRGSLLMVPDWRPSSVDGQWLDLREGVEEAR